ncbi:MAG: hypothetical protein ABI836_14805 [Gemmatimonadota bacterium]
MTLIRALAVAVGLVGTSSSLLSQPDPPVRKSPGFALFSRPLGAITINRVYCRLNNVGEMCTDSTNSTTVGGGIWPKGTFDQYVFNSGLQIAGIIRPNGGSWAADTAGAFSSMAAAISFTVRV